MPKQDRYRKPTSEQIARMKLDKDNMCDICRNFFDGKDHIMHVDHSHKTNKVRGLLCHRCNVGLGYFKDRISYLQSAADYLIKHAPPDYYDTD